MKKLFCFVLCLMLASAVCTAAAEETPPTVTEAPPAVTECPHSYGAGVVTTEANCGQAGVRTYTCSLCSGTKTESIPATGNHSWDGGSVTTAATCQAEGVKTFTCTVCGGTRTEPVAVNPDNHSYGPWNGGQADTHTRTCGCGASQSAPHSFDVTATVPATCKEEGATAYGCSACKRIEYEVIPKLTTHTYDNDCDPECNVCGAVREAAHKYSTAWSKDGLTHWHACTKCGDKADVGKHVPGPAATEEKAQLCLTCGYVLTSRLKHTHDYEKEFSNDETGHWYACAGCEERRDFAAHTYDNSCDPDCNVCGYVTDTAHTADDQWSSDETGHWHICTACGEFFQFGDHVPGDGGQCAACGFVLAPTEQTHTHAGEGDWLSDESFHWKRCQCGEDMDKEAHVWKESGRICTVCGVEKTAQKADTGSNLGLIALILIVVIILAAGAGIALILILMKKPGKYSK